ncbi:Aminomethyltransferase folate-binding domain-containing protein [Macrolepiota fuliginosa MF-IS2]|uniref:Aminomethyltransferase folate-binding domain-containing protein n=1 Tax=Macrolepiota fuliginosa MF-IS2 TaxID=1400762 RepID=A0A9P5XKM5_9AGAR|nr:Aminomethyltransferase folate-binding domain-containing protein [Macrolepiota fuliginosa MF-IS2]
MAPGFLSNLLRKTPTIAKLSNRGVLSVSGSQASEFLNGLLSTSVPNPPSGPFFSAFLHAQGRVMYDVFLYTTTTPTGQPGYLLEYDTRASEAQPLLSMLKRHVLRSKVKIRDVSENYDIWTAWGSESIPEIPRSWNWARSRVVEPVWEGNEWPWGTQNEALTDRRAVGMGRRLLARKGDKPPEASTYDVGAEDDYLLHRIALGVPEGSSDIVPMQAFPMESNLDIMGGLDFRKGCYVGQELTVRTYHTGVIRKRIVPVLLHQPGNPSQITGSMPQFPLHLDIRPMRIAQAPEDKPTPRPRGTGKLLSSRGQVGLALLRLEHVAGVLNKELAFEIETPGDGKIWQASPWWPSWWPEPPAEEE